MPCGPNANCSPAGARVGFLAEGDDASAVRRRRPGGSRIRPARYDVDNLKRFAKPKRRALVACFLAEANKSVLDHLVEMHCIASPGS